MLKIISGGQTGIDRMALEVAKELGIETGGYAPKGYLTEIGSDLTLKGFGLEETETSDYNYRTKCNIRSASGSILFGNIESNGSKLLIRYSTVHFYPFIINPTSERIVNYINDLKQLTKDGSVILNIAGNRGSKISEKDLNKYCEILKQALIEIINK
jgi:hypothetical protein